MSQRTDKEKRKKRKQSELEAFIFQMMQKSLEQAIKESLNGILKDLK